MLNFSIEIELINSHGNELMMKAILSQLDSLLATNLVHERLRRHEITRLSGILEPYEETFVQLFNCKKENISVFYHPRKQTWSSAFHGSTRDDLNNAFKQGLVPAEAYLSSDDAIDAAIQLIESRSRFSHVISILYNLFESRFTKSMKEMIISYKGMEVLMFKWKK